MSVTNYLLRPQPLRRRPQNDGVQALSELVDIVVLFVREQAEGGAAAQKVGAALQTSINELRVDLETRLQTAGGKIRTWFQPVLTTVQTGISAGQGTGSFEGFLNTVDVVLRLATQALEHLSADELATKLNEIGDILENDLGLSQRRLERWFSDFIENAVQSLTADYLAGNTSAEALRQFHLGAKLSVLRGLLLELTAQIPDFDRRTLVRDLAEMLKARRWDKTLERLRTYGVQANEALTSVRGNNTSGNAPAEGSESSPRSATVPNGQSGAKFSEHATTFEPVVNKRDVGVPAGKQYSWYASWFFESQFGFEAGKLDDRFRLNDAALSGSIAFKQSWLTPDFLENWAHWTAVGEDAGAALWHLLTRKEGDQANNWTQFAWHLTHGLTRSGAFLQDSEGWVTFFKMWENYFFRMGLSSVGAGLSGLENSPDKFAGWLHARFLPNLAKTLLYEVWLQHIRQFTLSFFTLANHDNNASTSQNYQKSDGFALPFVHGGILLGAWLPSVLWENRKHYGFPFSSNGDSWVSLVTYWVVGGVGLSFVGGLAGWALGGAIAGKLSDDYWGKSAAWQLPLLGAALWPVYTWLLWEGDTDEGKWGLDASGNVKTFAGYPAADNSPYHLPFPAGTSRQCVQGHHGAWSHNAKTEQLYALDFAMPYGDEILAMRGGTVVLVHDRTQDDNHDEQANRIVIRHDDPEETAIPDPIHDRGHKAGNPLLPQVAVTYAEYMHGRTDGIRLAFAAKGIPEGSIEGSRVRRGDPIMLAGNTGRSAYNHLHVHVMTSAPGARHYTTIPWGIRAVADQGGVPKSYRFYTSENTRTALQTPYAIVQPYETKGQVRATGNDWVELGTSASQQDDHYNDCHILVQFTNSEGQSFFQYRKISSYEGSDKRRATVASPWDFPLPANTRYEIGAKPYAQAGTPWKTCTFLADRDAGGTALPLASGREPDKIVPIAHFTQQTFSGGFVGGNATDNFITWQESGASPEIWIGRSLIVERQGELLLYRRVTAFDAATKRLEVDEPWQIPLDPLEDRLHLGALPYAQAGDSDKTSAFLAGVSAGPPRIVADFPDSRKAYVYLNFKLQS